MKKTIHKITEDEETDEILFFGIVTFEKEHKLCWAVNEVLKINMKVSETENSDFYVYTDEISYFLIPNKTAGTINFPEIKNIDFIVKITGKNLFILKDATVKLLKSIDFISAVLEIDITKLKKSKKTLLSY